MTTTCKEKEEGFARLIAELTLDHPGGIVTPSPWSCELTTGVRDVGIITTGSTQTFLVNAKWLRRVESGDFSD
jgi:hypothetical protein